ncbi:PKD domain-containing protein [Salinigranum rubrum]|uniref:PKD domain-containing protein n=1 Tax=Salinigranum rubrum TaxID=755307 RepID=UPI0013A5B61E|nr:PKD domain-containing protein [Salinigranum rubrum]
MHRLTFDRSRRVTLVAVVIAVLLGSAPSAGLVGFVGVVQGAGCTTISESTTITSPGCYVIGGGVEEHEDGDYIRIEASDVVLDGGGHTLDGGGNNNAVHVDGSYSNVTVRNLVVENWDRGIFVKDVTDATVRDVVGRSNKHAVEFDATVSSTVDNVSASENTEYGVYVKGGTDTTVTDSTATNNGRSGLFVDAYEVTVTDVVADSNTEHGVYLKDVSGGTVQRATATGNTRHGIALDGSPDSVIVDSTADTNGEDGVHVHHSDRSTVRNVTATGNTRHGIALEDSTDSVVVDSTADANADAGIRVHHSDRTLVRNVAAADNAHGVHLSSATTTLNDSTLASNDEGVRLTKHVHTVENVTLTSNTYGVYLDEPDDNVVRGSRINASTTAGIYFPDDKPENNLLYDNYLNNSANVVFDGSVPQTDWSVSRRTKTNVIGGSLVGGNYWAAPDGNGPSQLYDDADGDGFLDTPYAVASGTTDELPLTDVTAAFAVTPASADFGTVAFGSTATRSFTVESRVGSDVTVDSFDLSGDASSFSVSTDPAPVTLSTGATTTVEVTLSPTTTGSLSATLTADASADAYDTDTALTAAVTDSTDPTASTLADTTVDEDTSVSFDGSGSTDNVGIVSYSWAFGDGATATGQTPTHTYETPGTYSADLTVTDLVGNTDTATRTVTVQDVTAPVADAGSNRTVHVNTAVSFDAGGSTDNVGVDSYSWDFGDSSGTNGETPTHTYGSTGTYQVQLDVTDAAGNTGTDDITVEVVDTTSPLALPGGDRTVDEDSSVAFDGSASTDDTAIVSYDWDFDTGDTATGVSPSYTFSDPGNYTVTLTVEDGGGNVASNETRVTVRDVTNPTADAGSDATVDEGSPLSFDGSGSTDNVGIDSYSWTFGDGNSSTGPQPSHTYATPGTYAATLTVTDGAGETAADTRVVTVRDVTAPAVDGLDDRTVSVDESVAFDASGSTDGVGVDSYSWGFGDGSTATGATPTHAYETPGTYTVTYTATDAAGNGNTTTATVYVSDTVAPTPDTGGDRTVSVGESVAFDASGSTDDVGVAAYRWSFADETDVTAATTTRTFETSGTYSATLTVRDAAGNRASETVLVTVEDEPNESSGGGGSGGGDGGGSGVGSGGVTAPSTAAPTSPDESDAASEPTVQTAETTVSADEPTSVDLSTDGDAATAPPVGVTDIGFTPAVSEEVSLQVTSAQNLDGSPAFDRDDNTELLSNVRVDHSIDNADVSDVEIGFRVSKDRLAGLGVPAEDVALYRHQEGTWAELPTTVVGETADAYAFRASSPGLSEFAVGAKQPNFALQTVRVAVEEIRVGDDIQVFVRITNDGGADGSFVANLVIDGEVVENRELTIAAGGRRQVRFARPIGAVGSYTVQVNDALAGEVIVTSGDGDATASSASSSASSTDTDLGTETQGGEPATSGPDAGTLGVVGVGVLVLLGLVGYYRRES